MSRVVQNQILRLESEHSAAFNEGDVRGATKMFATGLVGFSSIRHARIRGTHVFTRKGKTWRVVHEHFSRAH